MSVYLLFSSKAMRQCVVFLFVFTFYSTSLQAQCAGEDNSITVCDIPNVSSKSINLFSLLLGSPVAGGTWDDVDLSNAVDLTTGILNAQFVRESGVYHFTYTVEGVSGCTDNAATITITIGGYPGVSGPNASVCSDEGSYNLFQLFDGNYLDPQSNGTWSDDDNSGYLSANFLGVESALGTLAQRTLRFTYTMPAIGTCPELKASQGTVTIYRAAKPGDPKDLLLCNSDYLTFSNNFDLNDLLIGEDAKGKWTESSGTTELTSTTDHFINIRAIFDTKGVGVYAFTYTVMPKNPACNPKRATVKIIIEKQLDLTGAKLTINSDICENYIPTASYSATLTQGLQPMVDGQYTITYKVSGPNGDTKTIPVEFISGVMAFPLPSYYFQQVGNFTVEITGITKVTDLGACIPIIKDLKDLLVINPLPRIDNSTLTINPVCQNTDALVSLSGIGNLVDGNFQIVYNLLGTNLTTAKTAIINVAGGLSDFTIPGSLLPKPGKTTISITNITNLTTGCTNTVIKTKEFLVEDVPIVSNLVAKASKVCKNQPIVINLSGLGTLTNITIDYILTGDNILTTQTIPLLVTNGSITFVVPDILIPNAGVTKLIVTALNNTLVSCGNIPVNNVSAEFTIFEIPTAPVVSNKSFCTNDNAKIANLVPSGGQYQWFLSNTSTTPLPITTPLVSGNYYVNEVTTTATKCESPRSMLTVVINDILSPTLNPKGAEFCGLDKPTLQQLSNNTIANGTLNWFDVSSGGTPLLSTTLLEEGKTYYGFEFSTALNCSSTNPLVVTVSLTKCDTTTKPPEEKYDFFIPDGFSPNDDTINDTFEIPKIAFLYPDYTLDIYNRYGNMMFQGNKTNPSWDGKNNQSTSLMDTVAPNGIYFYVINFNKDNKSPLQGRLYLNR
jgi:gliding motility-associated-like protein